MIKNYKFILIKDKEGYIDDFKKEVVFEEELKEARKNVLELIKKNKDKLILMSCWQCNYAHLYFLEKGLMKDCVLNCFGCGKFYYKNIDITYYSIKGNKK